MESNVYSNIQALLKEIMSKRASQKGKLRWTLQKKLESSPSSGTFLIRLVLKELDSCFEAKQQVTSEDNANKVFKTESLMNVIPLLHTLYYAIIQSSAGIPIELYQCMRECLTKLTILPPPFSSVALATLRSIKAEMITPGCLYQRRVVLEQNLKNEREKVFVLADPAACSAPLQAAIREHLEASHVSRDTTAVQNNVVLHVLRAGLGMQCRSSSVSQALEILGDQWTEKYFQQLAEVMEDSVKQGAGGHDHYLLKLKDIHSHIVAASTEDEAPEDQDSVFACSMPSPDIQFVTWHNDDDLWDLLLNFSLHCCPNTCTDEGSKERESLESREERNHCSDGESSPAGKPSSAFSRRRAVKNIKSADKLTLLREKMEAFSGSCDWLKNNSRCHTARVVVIGDDRVLGRLARAYQSIRERESKHLILTKRLSLRLYYIPLADVGPPPQTPCHPRDDDSIYSLSSFLGQVDPWYDSNVNGLQTSINKLCEMHCKNIKPSKHNLFLLDTLCYYLRCGSQHVKLPLYSVKMSRWTPGGCSVVEEMFVSRLEADIPEFKHLKEKSPEMQFAAHGKKSSGHGASLSITYLKTTLSKRQEVKGEAPMAYGVVITSEPTAAASGENALSVRFDCMNPECKTDIRTKSLIIKTVASRTLSVCLDQDFRRSYNSVQRMEISLCIDPGHKIQSSFALSTQREPALSQCLDNALLLPINTFSSLTP